MAAEELNDLPDGIPVDDEPITDEDIADVEYARANPEDRISHEEIPREFGLAGAV